MVAGFGMKQLSFGWSDACRDLNLPFTQTRN